MGRLDLIFFALLGAALAGDTCVEGPGGATATDAKASGHNLQWTKVCVVLRCCIIGIGTRTYQCSGSAKFFGLRDPSINKRKNVEKP